MIYTRIYNMPNSPLISLDKIYSVYKKVKILKVQERYSNALSLLEDLLRLSKKKYYIECSKITSKILSICNHISEISSIKLKILRQSESAISTYLNLSTKHKLAVSEKLIQKILISFNNCSYAHRLKSNYSLSLDYYLKCTSLIKGKTLSEALSFEMVSKSYLNMTSIYLQQKNFEHAVNSAQKALKYLQILIKTINNKPNDHGEISKSKNSDCILGYVIAFYCIFIAEVGLNNHLKANEAIRNAVEVGKQFLYKNVEIYEMVLICSKISENQVNNLKDFNSSIKYVFHLSLINSFDSIRFLDPVKAHISQSEKKLPGRYYTRSELLQKQKFIEDQKHMNFISADDYFFQEISKSINIKSDLKHLNKIDIKDPNSSNNSKIHIHQENLEKRIISNLRQKKNLHSTNHPSSNSNLQDKLKKIKSQTEPQSEYHQLSQVINSKQFKTLILKICPPNRTRDIFPVQKLFFKPKFPNQDKSDNETNSEVQTITDAKRRLSVYQSTKDEIENFMDSIHKEILILNTDRDHSKTASRSVCGSVKSLRESFLFSSANKSKRNEESSIGILKKAINISLRPRRGKLLRQPSSTQNLQV